MNYGDKLMNHENVMDKRERFSAEFVTDLAVALDHYDSISVATGNRFRENIDDRIDLVMQAPEGFAKVFNSVRAVRVKSYPYVILFEVQNDSVEFLGLVFGARGQQNWFERFSRP